MYNGKKILAVIPARGGSKGIPGKNIKPLNSKPLIGWTIEKALESKYLDRVFLSTDSQEIANVSKECGLEVPFLRPEQYARDESPSWEAVLHVIDEFEKIGEKFDYVAMLEPTSPMRKKDDIDRAIKIIVDNPDAKTLVTAGQVHTEHPMIVKKINPEGYVTPYLPKEKEIYQRQQADKAYFPYGVIYIAEINYYRQEKTFYSDKTLPCFIDRWQNYEIDDLIDFTITEEIIKQHITFM